MNPNQVLIMLFVLFVESNLKSILNTYSQISIKKTLCAINKQIFAEIDKIIAND